MPVQTKRNTLNFLGISIHSYKNLSSLLIAKYSSVFFVTGNDYSQYLLWSKNSDSRFPDTGWDMQIGSQVFPLIGENVEIVPKNSIGYKMDHTCDASSWDGNAFSFTDISCLFHGDTIAESTANYHASVYCYVSIDFDGTWVLIDGTDTASTWIIDKYDLSKKGIWQKLEIDFIATSKIPSVHLYFSKYGVKDFKSLKGYVIFAYPEYFRSQINISTCALKTSNEILGSSIAKSSFLDLQIFQFLVSKFKLAFSQDSIKSPTEDKYLKELEENVFSGPRTSRWYYSWMIFKDYQVQKKLFGGGFDYLEMFGTKFGEGKYDYPHNPFLSAFLYSGIIGGIAYIWFMFLVFYYYIKYYRYHLYFFTCFLVTFYFSFFSANTHFSVPIYAILSIIPFLTKYIVENEKENVEQPQS